MLIAIPIFANRISPRCTIADSVVLLRLSHNEPISQTELAIEESNWQDLLQLFAQKRVNKLVCGGINKDHKEMAMSMGISVIDNVAGDKEEIFDAISKNGFNNGLGNYRLTNNVISESEVITKQTHISKNLDCLACQSKECESGMSCPYLINFTFDFLDATETKMLETARDISLEEERTLCRLSELIYYALGMKYKKIGIAYCTELSEPTEILASVLRRFFDVHAVCCKAGGEKLSEMSKGENPKISCSPMVQAQILNNLGTDLNVIVGLCIGSDCLFSGASKAPCTTLFVKDKSLANNPIGAIYSDYYLKEATAERMK